MIPPATLKPHQTITDTNIFGNCEQFVLLITVQNCIHSTVQFFVLSFPFQFAGAQTTVSVLHTGSTELSAANGSRKYLLIQNLDANPLDLVLRGPAEGAGEVAREEGEVAVI